MKGALLWLAAGGAARGSTTTITIFATTKVVVVVVVDKGLNSVLVGFAPLPLFLCENIPTSASSNLPISPL